MMAAPLNTSSFPELLRSFLHTVLTDPRCERLMVIRYGLESAEIPSYRALQGVFHVSHARLHQIAENAVYKLYCNRDYLAPFWRAVLAYDGPPRVAEVDKLAAHLQAWFHWSAPPAHAILLRVLELYLDAPVTVGGETKTLLEWRAIERDALHKGKPSPRHHHEHYQAIGHHGGTIGGKQTLARHGREYFVELGRKSGKKKNNRFL